MYRIPELVHQIAGLAPAPERLQKLSELLRNANANIDQIEGMIHCDADHTASVLRCCNSVVYCGAEPAVTVEDALVRMGFNPVVDLVIKLATRGIYALPPEVQPHLGGLWDHCLLTGILTRKLAQNRDGMDGIGFTAGLLHDIGKVILIKVAPQQYSLTLDLAKRRRLACIDQEMEDFESTHAKIGGDLMGRWNLPKGIVAAITHHHHPGLNVAEQPLACCVALADALTYAVGYGVKDHFTRYRDTSSLLKELGLTSGQVTEMLHESLMEFEATQRIMTVDPSQ
jgi:putative nucleotidyltransferase with HDIG domain